jgi:linoleoyl-CoA desaturase
VINSNVWDWDTASTKEAWKHSHNYIHHTYTNVLGLDRDLGYEIMRIDPEQDWRPVYLLQPLYNLLLMMFFEWGVALHDLDFTAARADKKSWLQVAKDFRGILKGWPPDCRGLRPLAVAERSVFSNHLCGELHGERDSQRLGIRDHLLWAFPRPDVHVHARAVRVRKRRRKVRAPATRCREHRRSPLFHVISGNLGYQVEHHLFPDMPSTRYGEIAPRVREICERHDLPYNTGPLSKQLAMVQRSILRLAFPGGQPRPKPDAYDGPNTAPAASVTSRT